MVKAYRSADRGRTIEAACYLRENMIRAAVRFSTWAGDPPLNELCSEDLLNQWLNELEVKGSEATGRKITKPTIKKPA